jgi:diguanylate cyclase (GGDEF)-like protein/PAS domain S-box-containing protein
MAEQALRESREQIQLFIDHAPAALAMFDREMRYLAVSRRWMDDYGLGDLDIAGACHYDIFPEIPERWKDIHCRGLAGETIRTDEDRFDRADGSVQWLRREVRPWRLADGAVGGIVIFSEDITRSKQADERLRLAATVFTHAREGILITDADGAILDINDAFTQITGYTREEVLGRNPRMLSSGLHGKDFYREMWHDLVHKGQWYGEIWNRKKTGELFAALQTISTLLDAQGNITQFLEIFSDITLLKENERKLQHIAHFDLLTGLPNRVLLGDRMHQAMAQAHRRGQMLAVAYLDLDGFKGVNDSHGHEAGDQLLAALATRMKMALREGDTLARLGGDEFVAVLLDLPDVESCLPELNRLLEAAAMNVPCGDLELRVSASLGVTFYPQADDVDADQLLRQADQAMYQAKLSGRNRYHIFDSSQDRSVRGHHENLEQIRQALAANEFVLYYQPKVNMATGEFLGTEALIRWQHPQRGLLPPGVFLPVIEDHPLAVDLGEWVIETALAQMDTWQAMGLHIAVSVNVGARQLQQADFVDRLRALVAAHPVVDPSSLEIEVLETSALQDMSQVSQAIVDCRKLGVSVALDDFGTGYSSLAYLKRLPANILKIDQSFIRDMLEDSDDLAILEGVLGLALAFRRRVIAEGVETVGQGVMLLQLGCEQAQGFCIARPMPAAEIPSWIAAWRPDPSWVGVSAVGASDWPVLYAGVELRAWIASIESFFKEKLGALPAMDEHQCRFGVWLDTEKSGPRANLPAFQIVQTAHQRLHELAAQVVEGKAQGRMAEEITILDLLHSLRDQILEQLTAFMAGS